ncbi:hypothetical protein NEOLEDRAFT_340771 [Neolentinus lepideus HHB14362 ss-1]|uniref:Cytochrome P450 n=1 Tax=Neolentinus lepideus HHB14362 ss-1 TaxID=1314782 RepID=A0A165SWQ1_9AGAM|nr:hypothetical protein NEOLEDRAFT_340771 [Neolentinus lepideus HHB14362 ss-1]
MRAGIYSHRPQFVVAGELMGLNQSLPLLSYGPEWRLQRKLAAVVLNPTAIKKYHNVQEDVAALLNKDLLTSPEDFMKHIRLASGRIVLTITYGISVKNAEDEIIQLAEDTMVVANEAVVPGAFLADFLPFMKHLPS